MALKIQEVLKNEQIVYREMKQCRKLEESTILSDIAAIPSETIQKYLRVAAFRTRDQKVSILILVFSQICNYSK